MDDIVDHEAAMVGPERLNEAVMVRWLAVALKGRHDAVLREPVPDALLDLLRIERTAPSRAKL